MMVVCMVVCRLSLMFGSMVMKVLFEFLLMMIGCGLFLYGLRVRYVFLKGWWMCVGVLFFIMMEFVRVSLGKVVNFLVMSFLINVIIVMKVRYLFC